MFLNFQRSDFSLKYTKLFSTWCKSIQKINNQNLKGKKKKMQNSRRIVELSSLSRLAPVVGGSSYFFSDSLNFPVIKHTLAFSDSFLLLFLYLSSFSFSIFILYCPLSRIFCIFSRWYFASFFSLPYYITLGESDIWYFTSLNLWISWKLVLFRISLCKEFLALKLGQLESKNKNNKSIPD